MVCHFIEINSFSFSRVLFRIFHISYDFSDWRYCNSVLSQNPPNNFGPEFSNFTWRQFMRGVYWPPVLAVLTENQLKKVQSTKVIMTLWVRWKKPVKSTITLDPKDEEDAKDVEGKTDDSYTVEPVYRAQLVIADTFSWHPQNHGHTLIENPLHCGHFPSVQLL